MIEIQGVRIPCGSGRGQLEKKLRSALRPGRSEELRFSRDLRRETCAKGLICWQIARHSVDARKKPALLDVYTIHLKMESESRERSLVGRLHRPEIRFISPEVYTFPSPDQESVALAHRPVVIGSGPAGLFCALMLAENGYRPILLERGYAMDRRVACVEQYWKTGRLDPASNIQFGEGGAGTFSDGKLTTNVKDKCGRHGRVLDEFIEAGAPEDICYEHLPHIGTDYLRGTIVRMREKLIALGGEVRFGSQVTDFLVENGCVRGVIVERQYELPAEVVVLAPGHSARDTIRRLREIGVPLVQKNFAVGFRVSHPQSMIDLQQYGVSDREEMRRLHLPAASYKLTAQLPSGRGIYSFCMCPGGYIVDSSSEPGRTVVNGMSDCARDAERANSAIVMTVGEEEFGSPDPLAGMAFQERLEARAYALAGGRIPVEAYADFERGYLTEKESVSPDADSDPGPDGVRADLSEEETARLCLKGRSALAPLHTLLSSDMTEDFIEGMRRFDRTIPGFAGPEAYVCGVETRTSSPVRIPRNDAFESALRGLYPCGEGAGYAGGIMSAAIDGIKVAEAIGRAYRPPEE